VLAALAAASAVGATPPESSVANHFQLYVPPNNDVGTRYSAIVITAVSGTWDAPTVVDLIDDDADGDDDDTQLGVNLVQGESLVRYIRDGAVNDDLSGAWDGDYMIVRANRPVSAYLVTDSDWQHDWAPAVNGSLRGTRFFLYANRTSVTNRDVDVFAYDADTRVALYDVTYSPLTTSGRAAVAPRSEALLVADLDEGEDLRVRHGLGLDLLQAGHTYELVATRPVTVQFGALGGVTNGNGVRDGGGYVPGRSGSALDNDFYFTIPHDQGRPYEQELRIIAADDNVTVNLLGWDDATGTFEQLSSWTLDRLEHADWVGGTTSLYRLEATGGRVALFEANWLETGSAGTSDVAAFAPALLNPDGSADYLVYVGPPGRETNTVYADVLSHVYLFSRAGAAGVTVRDADTQGTYFSETWDLPALGWADVTLDVATHGALNQPASGLRPYLLIQSPSPLAVNMANWNDNWMAYARAVVGRNPDVQLSALGPFEAGQSQSLTGSVTNSGDVSLTDLAVEVFVPSELDYVDATLDGAAPDSVETSSAGTAATFSLPSLAPGASADLLVTVEPVAGTSGDVASVGVVATADEDGTRIGSSESVPATLQSDGVASLSGLSASPGDSAVTLEWQATASVGVVSSVVVQRAGSPDGPWSLASAAPLEHVGTGASEAMSFVDTGRSNGVAVYYRVRATGPTGEAATAGPVVAVPEDTSPPPVPTLTANPQDRAVVLYIGGSGVPDLVGYHVERSRTGTSNWTRITSSPISGPELLDGGRSNGTDYAYRAWAVDDDGNTSARSPVVWATPSFVEARTTDQVVAFEDMIGPGANDWDYNDFIVREVVRESYTQAGGLFRIEIDYEPLARGAGYVHELRQRVALVGTWSATLQRFAPGDPSTPVSEQQLDGNGPLDVAIYDDTRDALPPDVEGFSNTPTEQGSWSAPTTAKLVVQVFEPEANPDGSLGDAPFDIYLRLPYLPLPNEIHRVEVGGATELSERAGPLDGVSLPFVQVNESTTPTWPFEGEPVWNVFPSFPDHVLTPSPSNASWHAAPISLERVFHRGRGENP
jgi:LruC domain-containing protein